MKKILFITLLLVTCIAGAQVKTAAIEPDGVIGSNAFLDASSNFSTETGVDANIGKGLVFPSVDLVNFEFDFSAVSSSTFPTIFNGMIVYNNASGTTLTTGNRSSTATVVSPGFYYFSNPDGYDNYVNVSGDPQVAAALGEWLPLGGGTGTGVKSKTVPVTVLANPTSATLDLGTGIITANEVVTFLGAKVYDSAGNLVMTADSSYDKTTNVLTTGNGIMYHVLPAGDYTVVVDYK